MGNIWAWMGGAAALYLLLDNDDGSPTKKKGKVDIQKSIDRTFGHEGPWEPETAAGQKADTGNYYKGVYYGTQRGVTARFLVDNFNILQIPLTDKNTVRNLSVEQCTEIFQRTEGMRMRYDDFQDQAVADFVFDWMVHRPGHTKESGGCVYFMTQKILGVPVAACLQNGIYTDYLMQLINGSDPSGFYNSLKYWRLWHLTNTDTYKSFRKGIYNRITAFNDFHPTANVVEMMKAAKFKAFGY